MNSNSKPSVRVIGAGVIGLTTALQLQREGYSVRVVYAKQDGRPATSFAAAAFWYPFHVNGAREEWGEHTFEKLAELSEDSDRTGVKPVEAEEYFETFGQREAALGQWFAGILKMKQISPSAFPRSNDATLKCAVSFKTYVAEMDTYMRYLEVEIGSAGGELCVLKRPLEDLHEALDCEESIVVNCAGIGARPMIQNTQDEGARLSEHSGKGHPLHGEIGQVVLVPKTEFDKLILMRSGQFRNMPFYIVPRINDILIGGTVQALQGPEIDRYRVAPPLPKPLITERILARCREFFPELELGQAHLQEARLGIRPARSPLRLEVEQDFLTAGKKTLVHNYGHGGAGVTFSWGCARRVHELLG